MPFFQRMVTLFTSILLKVDFCQYYQVLPLFFFIFLELGGSRDGLISYCAVWTVLKLTEICLSCLLLSVGMKNVYQHARGDSASLYLFSFPLSQHLTLLPRMAADFVGCHYTTISRVTEPIGATHCISYAPNS